MSFSLERMLYYYGPAARAGNLRAIFMTQRLLYVQSAVAGRLAASVDPAS